jgi:hypothetical protein
MIGPRSDSAIAGVDNRKPKGEGVDRKTRECPNKAAVGRNHECSSWMRELVAITIIDGNKSQGFRENSDRLRVAP